MKNLAISIVSLLVSAFLVLILSPSPGIFTAALGACFVVVIVVGWSCTIRERSFGVLGFSDLSLRKPFKAKLSAWELIAIQVSAGAAAGMLLALAWRFVAPV